ncbi:MAG: hypothetical protein R3Y57_02985 [Erysipelotrichaceae bacterium]
MIIFFMTLAGSALLFVQVKTYIEKRRRIKEELEKDVYESITQMHYILYFYIAFIFFAVFSIVYGVYILDDSTISIGVLLLFMSVGEVISFNNKFKLYYNGARFICNGTVIRYRSIKGIRRRKGLSLGVHELETLTGQREILSKKGVEVIKQYVKVEVK